jgi:hypothetical protein
LLASGGKEDETWPLQIENRNALNVISLSPSIILFPPPSSHITINHTNFAKLSPLLLLYEILTSLPSPLLTSHPSHLALSQE